MSAHEHLDIYILEGILREANRRIISDYMRQRTEDSRLAAENHILELLVTHVTNNEIFHDEPFENEYLRRRAAFFLDGLGNLAQGVPGGGYNKKYTRRTSKNIKKKDRLKKSKLKNSKLKRKKETINNKGKRKTHSRSRLSRRARTYKGKKRR